MSVDCANAFYNTNLFLEDFLQMPIILAGRIGKFGSAFSHQYLPLSPCIVLFGKYSSKFVENFKLQINVLRLAIFC